MAAAIAHISALIYIVHSYVLLDDVTVNPHYRFGHALIDFWGRYLKTHPGWRDRHTSW
jgi:hypothetical protein